MCSLVGKIGFGEESSKWLGDPILLGGHPSQGGGTSDLNKLCGWS